MADIDISDLPVPQAGGDNVDISDLPAPASAAAAPSPYDTIVGGNERVAGLGGRAVLQGVGQLEDLPRNLAHMADSAGVYLLKKAGWLSPDYQLPNPDSVGLPSATQGATKIADAVGLPTPATPVERIGSAAVSAIPGAILAPEAPVAGLVRSLLGGTAAQGVAEAGGGPLAQTVAGAVAGSLPGPGSAAAAARSADVDLLRNEGIPLSTAQATASKLAQHVERASAMTGDAAGEFAQTQQEAFNRAVLKRIGVAENDAAAATPDVLSDARDRITGVMDDVASRSKVALDPPLTADLATIQQRTARVLPASQSGPIETNIADIRANAAANGGTLDGQFVQKLNSNLSALRANPQTAPIASDLQDAVNDAIARSANPADVKALAQARQRYRALKQIENAVDPSTGNVSAPKLINSLSVKANRNQSLYGQGDQSLMILAKAAKRVLPDALGNSGTAERALPAIGAIETLGSGEPIKAATKLVAGVGGLNVAGRALRSQPISKAAQAVANRNGLPRTTGAAIGGLAAQLGITPPQVGQ